MKPWQGIVACVFALSIPASGNGGLVASDQWSVDRVDDPTSDSSPTTKPWLTNEKQNEVSYTRGAYNFNVYYLPALARDLNAVGVGHSLAYEALVTGKAKTLESKTYADIVHILKNPPRFAPNERLLANTFSRRYGVLEQIFEQTHLLHAQTVDVLANAKMTQTEKEREIERLYRVYESTLPYAITPLPLNMGYLYGQSYSRRFRDNYPKTNGLFWGYHWLQGAMYDALYGKTPEEQKKVYEIIGTQYRETELYRTDRNFMPMTGEVSPRFALRFPELANVFDNLHMLHDMVNDILVSGDKTQKQKDDAVRIAIWRVMAAAHKGYKPGDAPEPGKWRDYRYMDGMPGMGQMPDMPRDAMFMPGMGWMSMASCHHCSMPMATKDLHTVSADGWTMRVRCPLCARDMSAETKGRAVLHLATEDANRPLILLSDEQGNLNPTNAALGKSAVFLEREASHAGCSDWSQAFTSRAAFDRFVNANPEYANAKPIPLTEWQTQQGKKPDTYFKKQGPPGNPFDAPSNSDTEEKGAE